MIRTPRTTLAANRLYLQAVALLERIPVGEKQRVRQRAQAMTTAALRQAARENAPPSARSALRKAVR